MSQDVIFYLLWYNVIRWISHIRKKSSFLSLYSLLVNNTRKVLEQNWQSVTKLNRVKNAIMQVTYLLNGPMFNFLFLCRIVKIQIIWKMSAF